MKLALKDHMTRKLVTVPQSASVAEAQRLMTNYWIRHLPVMDEKDEHIIGMLSERDLLRASSEMSVEQVMSSPIKTFPIDTPLKNVVEAMIEEKVSAFLVTKNDDIVGIITSEDLLVVLERLLNKESGGPIWSISELLLNPTVQRTAYIVGQAGI